MEMHTSIGMHRSTEGEIHLDTKEPHKMKSQLVQSQAIKVAAGELLLLKHVQVLEVGMCTIK